MRFATLTGNASFLLSAIDVLLSDEKQTLKGAEITAKALLAPNYGSPMLMTKYNNKPEELKLPKNFLHAVEEDGHYYTYDEEEAKPSTLILRYSYNAKDGVWVRDSQWSWKVWRKFSKPFSLHHFFWKNSE